MQPVERVSDRRVRRPEPAGQHAEGGGESTLLPMLIAGLVLIVLGMIGVTIFV